MRIPFLSSKDVVVPMKSEPEDQGPSLLKRIASPFIRLKDWVLASDAPSLEKRKVEVKQGVGVTGSALKLAKLAEGVLSEEASVGTEVLGRAVSTAQTTLSLAELRSAIERMQQTTEVKELVDSLLTAILQIGRISGGFSSLAAIAEEVELAAETMGKLSAPLLIVSGCLAIIAPIQLGLRWWDSDRCLSMIEDGLKDLDAEHWNSLPEAHVILAKLQNIAEQDPLYLERTFRLDPDEQAEVNLLVQRILQDSPGACNEGEGILLQLAERLKKSVRGQQVDLIIALVSLSSFGFAMLTPMGTTAQVIGGIAAVLALGKVGYDHWQKKQLEFTREIEMSDLAAVGYG